jgi:8-oxo-dGTP pyrophosphatase MutT (NUDIX family)
MKKSHLGIYAVIEKDDQLLVVKKTRGPYLGMWDLPGGSPEFGESIEETLRREVLEETGFILKEAFILKNVAFCVDYQENGMSICLHHTCLIYKGAVEDFSHLNADIQKEDVAGCTFYKKEDLAKQPISKVILALLQS